MESPQKFKYDIDGALWKKYFLQNNDASTYREITPLGATYLVLEIVQTYIWKGFFYKILKICFGKQLGFIWKKYRVSHE